MSTRLSRRARVILAAAHVLVPVKDRADYLRRWHAELWHLHHPREGAPRPNTQPDMLPGLFLDALWLRAEACRVALRGSALACLASLTLACLLTASAAYVLTGSLGQFKARIAVFLLEAPLLTLVTFATMSRRHIHDATSTGLLRRARRQLFLVVKSALTLMFSFLISVELTQPTHSLLPLASDLLETLIYAGLAIAGLRWAILDQQNRCKHCLCSLAAPAHVGRPSHNLLEWNGTEQICGGGHGILIHPELESSWNSHSRWLNLAHDEHHLA